MLRRQFLKGTAGLLATGVSSTALAQDKINPHILELIKVHWCFGHPKLRRNIYSLYQSNPNHPVIQAYRQGVSVMRGRPANDPTSWLYQANIHGTSTPGASWPAGAPWSTCNHGFHFLSWHRMYLYFFERIVRAASGDPDFALPYWDYAPVAHRTLPPPFRTPNNATNSLWDGTRPGMNAGGTLPASAVNSTSCLIPLQFLSGGQFQSSVQQTPHNAVHGAISGNMGAFETAGQDPIFWLHHCNIDRLWEKWLAQGGGRVNPTSDATWMNTSFTFVDENKNFVQMTGADILYTINQLHYQYEDPRTCVPPWWYYLVASVNISALAAARTRILASVLLTRNIRPKPEQARIDLPIDAPDAKERLANMLSRDAVIKTVDSNARYTLVFEGLQTDDPLDGYFEVYLGLPRDQKPDPDGPYYVGNLTLFGTDANSRQSMKRAHSGHAAHDEFGEKVTLDVSEALKRLAERGETKNELAVTLVPAGVTKGPGERFMFNPGANPRIESIGMKIEKDE